MQDIKVSVIIPVYNTEKYLTKCLDSVTKQSLDSLEILCVDDGSTDGSFDILSKYAGKDQRLKILKHNLGNRGPGFSRNLALSHAKGQYVAFIDSDDYIHLDMLKEMYNVALKESADLVMCTIKKFSDTNDDKFIKCKYDKHIPKKLNPLCFSWIDLSDVIFKLRFTSCNKLYRRDYLTRSNLQFPEGVFYEDMIFTFKALLLANKMRIIRKKLYFNRIQREGSTTYLQDGKVFGALIAFDELGAFLNENPEYKILEKQFAAFKFKKLVKYLHRNDAEHIQTFYDALKSYSSDPLLKKNEFLSKTDYRTLNQIKRSNMLEFIMHHYWEIKKDNERLMRQRKKRSKYKLSALFGRAKRLAGNLFKKYFYKKNKATGNKKHEKGINGNHNLSVDLFLKEVRELGSLEEAELRLKEGLAIFPQNKKLLWEYADLAMKRKEWSLAVTRWDTFFKKHHPGAAASAYVYYALALKNKGELDKTEGRSTGDINFFEKAEAILQEALIKFPNNANIHKQLAGIALSLRDKDKSIERLRLIIEKYPQKATATVFVNLVEVYKKEGDYEKAEHYLHMGLNKYPRNKSLLIENVRIAYQQKRWEETIKRGDLAIKELKEKTPIYIYYNLYFSNKRLGDIDGAISYIRKSSSKFELMGEQSFQALRSREYEKSLRIFKELLDIVDLRGAEEIWLKTYESLLSYMNGNKLKRDKSQCNVVPRPINKIIVSGMGWSGSGALYAYFNEFKSVSAIKNEFKHIRGLMSLYNVLNSASHKFKDGLAETFWFTLYGFIVPESKGDLLIIKDTKKITLGSYPVEYAWAVNYFINEIISLDHVQGLSGSAFKRVASQFIDLLVEPYHQNRFILSNNTIRINHISMVALIDSYDILCSFRDPRSNYVALFEEKKDFYKSVEEYIEEYRSARTKYVEGLKCLTEEQLAHVHPIQFEDFVLREECRVQLAKKIGLDLNDQNKNSFFKPRESAKNVDNYKDFHDQKAINQIKQELSEYLYIQ